MCRRHGHLLLEAVDDLDAVVETVRLVEFLGRRGILQAPRAVGPDVNLAHRTDHAGIQDFPDRAPRRRGVPLVAHLRGQLRILGGGLADEARLPDIVGERLLAIDVLAVRQRQIGGKRMRVLRRGHHDGVEVIRAIEDAPEVGEFLRLRVTLRRGVERDLVDVAKHGDVLVRMRRRPGRSYRQLPLPPFGAGGPARS